MSLLARVVPLTAVLLTACTNTLEASWCEENAMAKLSNCSLAAYIQPSGIHLPQCLDFEPVFSPSSPHSLADRQRLCMARGGEKGEHTRSECILDALPAATESCTLSDTEAAFAACQGSSDGNDSTPTWVSDCSINFDTGFQMTDQPSCCTDDCWFVLDRCLQTCSVPETAACIDCSVVCLEERRLCAHECYR